MEFHISRAARDKHQFDQTIFNIHGDAIFPNYRAAQLFAEKMNQSRDLLQHPEQVVRASEINALGLIDEIFHLMIYKYQQEVSPKVMHNALDQLKTDLFPDKIEQLLREFNDQFPPSAVYAGELSLAEYLFEASNAEENQTASLEEVLVLWLENQNPAFTPYQELFDDQHLQKSTHYPNALEELYRFFDRQPGFGPDQLNLIDFLMEPARRFPHSLEDQLTYIRRSWGEYLGDYLIRLLISMDQIREETKFHFTGPGEVHLPDYAAAFEADEPIRFAIDKEWMPKLVLIAKNSYVWLDQLSKKYQRPITRLDQIPDEELRHLAEMGFTGLWLIGLWERSTASARIKQMCGNPEAIASAYSLSEYEIAEDLGGYHAYRSLHDRALRYGVRLGSDMVPNHMGIDSKWTIEHPDWFINLNDPPFPSYSFNGPDLSNDMRASIYLEDHYYDRTDAAVVFKHIDRRDGRERYIYHGNDGTSMPWNDTAQLNYLLPEVREAVIQTILQVARKFPIIRFDAAMTLAKKHYQRLWYPEPGSGGDIASRAEHGLTKDDFDRAMPEEFWHEVVDRVAQEVPDTLLLAEAFWMMEGYFVRSLGMHRVYNSAFMNILRDEDNAKYRRLIQETLEFEPQILQRYVNFMNNPDERTAVEQFGKGDKYFGICVLMATFPGLPMFGHGQIEGFTEKYGMEYKRAYWDEYPDLDLYERHKQQIFPLLHRRELFSYVDNFRMFNFQSGDQVNEDVFAFSNRRGFDKALVIYHNRYAETNGWVKHSVSYAEKQPGEKDFSTRTCTLAEALDIHPAPDKYIIFRDQMKNLQYIRHSQEIARKGLFFSLKAYESNVLLDFYEITDDSNHTYRRLCSTLNGSGVGNIQDTLQDLVLEPVKHPLEEIFNRGYFDYLLDQRVGSESDQVPAKLLAEVQQKTTALLNGIENYAGYRQNRTFIIERVADSVEAILKVNSFTRDLNIPGMSNYSKTLEMIQSHLTDESCEWLVLLSAAFFRYLGCAKEINDYERISLEWFDEWKFDRGLRNLLAEYEPDSSKVARMIESIRLLIQEQCWYERFERVHVTEILRSWLANPNIQRYLHINRYNDVVWFNLEAFEEFEWWMITIATLQELTNPNTTPTSFVERALGAFEVYQQLEEAKLVSEYRVDKLINALKAY